MSDLNDDDWYEHLLAEQMVNSRKDTSWPYVVLGILLFILFVTW